MGCDRISAGCDNCYALALAGRLKAMGQPKYQRPVSQSSLTCSNRAVGVQLPDWWGVPAQCQAGHGWGPGLVIVSWHPCDCPAALAEPGNGHQVVRCGTAGCTSAWYEPRHGPG